MNSISRIVIIGAGMAGARAVINLRANGYEGAITLVGEEALLPYDRPPLSKASILADADPEPVWLLDAGIVTSLKAEVITGVAAKAIDRTAKTVLLTDGRALPYDKLLIATGARPRKLPIPGGEHALLLRNQEDMLDLRKRFLPGKTVVIIGGGFIGLELASSAAKKGCSVTLLEAQPRILMRGVPEAIAKIIHDRHMAAGVTLLTATGISHLTANSVQLADGRVLPADTIIAGIGASPEITLAKEAGLTIDNGIACDENMRTSDPDIFAAGDCASFIHAKLGNRRIRLEAWRSAQEQAATAAENMLGGTKQNVAVPWFWSDQYELGLQIAAQNGIGGNTLIIDHNRRRGLTTTAIALGHGFRRHRDCGHRESGR